MSTGYVKFFQSVSSSRYVYQKLSSHLSHFAEIDKRTMKIVWEIAVFATLAGIFVLTWLFLGIRRGRIKHVHSVAFSTVNNNHGDRVHHSRLMNESKADTKSSPATKNTKINHEEDNDDVDEDNNSLTMLSPTVLSPYFSIRNLALIRLFIAIYCLIILIVVSVGSTSGVLYSFYTVWNWVLLSFYFLLSSIVPLIAIYGFSFCNVNKHQSISQNSNSSNNNINNKRNSSGYVHLLFVSNNKISRLVHQLTWILFQMHCSLVLLVDVTVWGLLYWIADESLRKEFFSFYNLSWHGLNAIFIYFDLFINMMPIYFDNAVFVVFLAMIYCLFEWLFYFETGFWDYFFMDTSKVVNIIFYIIIFSLHVVFFAFARLIAKCRDKKIYQKKNYTLSGINATRKLETSLILNAIVDVGDDNITTINQVALEMIDIDQQDNATATVR